MYPNPQDVVPLPSRPDLAQYKEQAKDLSKSCKTRGRDGIRTWTEQWIDKQGCVDAFTDLAWSRLSAGGRCALSDAQFLIARAYGFSSWPKFARHVEALQRANTPVSAFESAADAIVAGDLDTVARLLRDDSLLISRAVDARASSDAAALRGCQWRRKLSAEDAEEHRADRRDAARCRC